MDYFLGFCACRAKQQPVTMSKPQKRKLDNMTNVDTASCRRVKRIRRIVQIPEEMKIKFEQAKEAEE